MSDPVKSSMELAENIKQIRNLLEGAEAELLRWHAKAIEAYTKIDKLQAIVDDQAEYLRVAEKELGDCKLRCEYYKGKYEASLNKLR